MARQMVLARKGGPGTPNEAGAPSESRTPDARDPGAPDSGNEETVTCPNCGCEFDPDQAEDDTEPSDGKEPGGADLEVALGAPDEQAPVGTDAVTKALAAVLGASRGGA